MTKVQRYKVGYYTDEWGMSSNTPCLIPDDSGYAVKFEDYCKLETELAALKAELREICDAIDDPACDLTLTAVECIKKLKAENESLKRDSTRLDALQKILIKHELDRCKHGYSFFPKMAFMHEPPIVCSFFADFRDLIDAAMAKGEQGC